MKRQPERVLRCLRRVANIEARMESDQALLRRFLAQHDEAAFAVLMRRHGPMVLRVARRTLQNEHDAEDVLQATFLVLTRKAQTVRRQESLASWLHGVSYRLALKVRGTAAQRRQREQRAEAKTVAPPLAQITVQEAQAILDEELSRLPDKFRAPIVLCCLEGLARDEASHQLGCPVSVLKSRLAQGRVRLRQRLVGRGLTLPGGLGAVLLLEGVVGGAVPQALIVATTRAARTMAAGGAASAAVSSSVAALMDGATTAVLTGKAKALATFVVALGLLVAGLGVAHQQASERPGAEPGVAPARAVINQEKLEAKNRGPARTDVHGDALPTDALARLGTLRQRAADAHVAVSADGKDIITVGTSLTVRVWDASTGELRSLRQLADAGVYRTFLSPHGKYLLTDSYYPDEGHRLGVWDLAAGKLVHTRSRPRRTSIEGAAFSPDERRVAIAETTNSMRSHHIRVWDLEPGQVRTLHEYDKQYTAFYFDPVVQFSPDSSKLVAIQRDKMMRCWDVATGQLAWEAPTRYNQPHFCFTSDSKTIVSTSDEPLDVATGKRTPWKTRPPQELFPVGCSPDGRLLAFLTLQQGILFWEIATGKTALEVRKDDHDDSRRFVPSKPPTNFAFTPDSTGFIWRSDVIQRWDLADGKPAFPQTRAWGHTEAVAKLVFAPDGKLLASAGRYDRVLLWDVASARPLFTIPGGFNRHLAFAPDGKHLLTPLSRGKTVLGMWDTSTGQVARGFELADPKEFGMTSGDTELRTTSDGKKILMLTFKNGRRGDESVLTVWDTISGACLRHEVVPWGQESALTPDGESVLALDSPSGDVVLRAVGSAAARWKLPLARPKGLNTAHDCDLCLSADGRLFAARVRFYEIATGARSHDDLRIGDTATGRQWLRLPVVGPAVFDFSADGRLFALAGADGVRFWEIASGKQAGFLPAHNRDALPAGHAFATALAFAPDGRTLATGHADTTILLWDVTFRKGAARTQLADADRNALWSDLAGESAAAAQAAFWRFVDDPEPSVAFLRMRLQPMTAAAPEVTRPLLADLNSDQFKVRAAAERQLRALGERAEPALRQALKTSSSLETIRRIEALLTALESSGPLAGEPLRGIRTVQVLEQIGSQTSRRALDELAKGVPSARLTRAARESLERMRKQ
jgi:RNA polymerase sigma factor (sigma-70 family)